MSVKCVIQFPNGDRTQEAELDFDVADKTRPQVTFNYQIGYLEHPQGDKVFHEKDCRNLWFTIRKTN
jgi:hypothetical protein